MGFSINSLLESVTNPGVCLKTLTGLFVIRDDTGEPVFTISEYTVKFLVEWNGLRYRLICPLKPSAALNQRAWAIFTDPQVAGSSFIAPTRYLSEEMLVFDYSGDVQYLDVLLQEIPNGKTMDRFLLECSEQADKQSPRKVLSSLLVLAEWLYGQRLIHQNIRLSNVIVRPDHTLVLVHLDMARKLTPEQFAGNRNARDRDNLAIGYLTIILYVIACTPKTYILMRQSIFRRLPDLKKMLPEIEQVARIVNSGALAALIARLRRSNGKLVDRPRLHEEIRAIIAQLPQKDIKSMLLTQYPLRGHRISSPPPYMRQNEGCELKPYWSALPADTLVRCESDGKYFYTDMKGDRIDDREYDFAYDFAEGRAVVVKNNDYALIDRDGDTVIPFICEDLEWDADQGVAKAMIEGKWGLFNRSGETLIPLEYDWLGTFGNDLIVAQREDLYGYLRRDGSIALPFIYDDAYSFDHGVALVEIDGDQFLVDIEGNRIEDELAVMERRTVITER